MGKLGKEEGDVQVGATGRPEGRLRLWAAHP